MKKIFTTFMLIAAAALTFSSCEREEITNTESDSAITLHITANTIDTKTVFGEKADGAYPVKWTTNKQVAFSLNETTPVGVTPVVISEGAGASFDVTFTEGGETGTVYAFSPMGVHDSENPVNNQPGFTGVNASYKDAYLNIPNVQTPLANSCDESAQALFASQEFNGADTDINMTFNHVVAYGKMAIKNFTGTISKVDIVFPEPVCGTSCYYYYAGDDEGKVKNANVNTITLYPDNVVGNVFWFACAPTAGATGSMRVIVTDSNDKTYTKTIDLTAKALPFTQGKVSSFGVDFNGIEAEVPADAVFTISTIASAKSWENGTAYNITADDNGKSNIKITYSGGGNNGKYYNSDESWRLYNGGGMTIASQNGETITRIEIVKSKGTLSATNYNNESGIWTGSASSVQFTATATTQIQVFKVWYDVPTTYAINIDTNISNGQVTASTDHAAKDVEITLTATPAAGYRFVSWDVKDADNASVPVTDNKFIMPAKEVIVSATFETIPIRIIRISTCDNGSVEVKYLAGGTITDGSSIMEGTVINIEAKADEGYKFKQWAITGASPAASTATTTITVGNSNITIGAEFEEKGEATPVTYNIAFKDSGNDSDGTQEKTSINELIATGGDYISSISATKVYQAKSGYGVKFGSGSAKGILTLDWDSSYAINPVKVKMEIAMYDAGKHIKLSINEGTAVMLSPTTTFATYEFTMDGNTALTSISIEGENASKNRFYLKSITVTNEE